MKSVHVLSLVAISSIIALSGCADNKKAESTQEATTEDSAVVEVDAVEPVVAEEEVVVIEEVVVEEKNPPRFSRVTDYLALNPNTDWQWETLAGIPGVREWRNKTPTLDGDTNYSIIGDLDDHSHVAAYGTKTKPSLVNISSGQGIAEDETTSAVYKLEDLFREKELTRVESNCDTDEDFSFSQHFYKWQKEGYQPLYVLTMTDEGNSGTSKDFGIAKSFEEFYKPENRDMYPNLIASDDDGNEITCTFEL
ncbi:hypothetical protein [Psychrobacter immobilis]|uniref:hypothetical protein n=1 Tax=Psychrobacter immobilis TaxID=498 RepID=UPI0019199D85|nr:hypothetical protein [Psychrobacter immobilis]